MSEPGSDLAAQLRRLREERGASFRAWSERTGLPVVTLSRIEGGNDIGWASVRRLARRLPELPPSALLGSRASGPRPASARSWAAWAELVGFHSRRVTLTLDEEGRATVEVEGLRTSRGSLSELPRRIATLGAVLIGPPDLAYELETTEALPLGRPRRFETEDAVHEIRVPRDPDRDGLAYRRTTKAGHVDAFPHGPLEGPFEGGSACWLDHPTELLVLRTPASLGPVVPWAWPASLAPSPEAALALWRRLHPHAPPWLGGDGDGAGERNELRVERPAPGLAYGLAVGAAPGRGAVAPDPAGPGDEPAPSSALVRPLARAEPGPVLHRARLAEGLSQRDLAERVGCSPATISRLEAGAEPRLSLVRACLKALPSACPFELLPLPETPPTPAELWCEQRVLLGMESREERRRIDFADDGTAQIESRSVGLTWDPLHGEELRLRFGTARSPSVAPDWELEAVSARPRPGGTRVRVVERSRGGAVHELRLEEPGDGSRLDLVRRMSVAGADPATLRQPAAGERRSNFVFLAPTFPCRSVSAEVRLPPGLVPRGAWVTCSPRACPPAEGLEDLSDKLRPEGLQAEVDPGRRRISFRMERPLLGLRIELTWTF